MSDVFQEVEEEIRKERYRALWKRFGPFIIAAALLIVAGVGGWRAWDWYQNRQAAEMGTAYARAMTLVREGKGADAAAELARIGRVGPDGYRTLARFAAAAELGQRDRPAAIAAYDALAADTSVSPLQRDLAQVRAGLLLVDTASLDEIRRRMEPLTGAGGAFRHVAREAIGLVAWRVGDQATAKKWFDMILADSDVPSGVRQRIEVVNALGETAGAAK